MYWDSTLLILIPALIFGLIAQGMVKSAYDKYSRIRNTRNMTGAEAARLILDENGLSNVTIERVSGELSDHFDPRANVIRLSDGVYNADSVAAIGIAAHEAGHAVQYAQNYSPIKIRNSIIPITQVGSSLSMPLVIAGLIFSWDVLITVGILLFCAVVIFQAITLPVEFNASSRAIKALKSEMLFDDADLYGVKKVLTAAALTYVAAMISALLSLLRLLILRNRRR